MRHRWWLVAALLCIAGAAHAVPSVRGVGTQASSTGDLSDIAVHPDTIAGDLMLLTCETADQTISTPAGWTIVPGSPVANTGATKLSIFYRFATSDDIDGSCEVCNVTDPGNHVLCAIMSVADVNPSDPFDVYDSTTGSAQASTTIPGATSSSASSTLVIAAVAKSASKSTDPQFSSWANSALPGGCTSLTSLTGQLTTYTIEGDDGALGMASGVITAGATWCDTTVSGPAKSSAQMGFNLNDAPSTPTVTPTPTVTQTRTVTNTPTITQTPTITNTPTVTNTATRTPTQTSTYTVTNTPTRTPIPAKCAQRATNGAITLKTSCTLPEDDGFFIFEKPTPGSTEFTGFGAAMPHRFFRDAEAVLVTSNPAPDTLQIDNTLAASLTESRWVQFGLSAAYVPTYTSGDVASWGGCTNDQACTISSAYDFTGTLPKRDATPVAVWPPSHASCGPIPLTNGTTYYCAISGGSVSESPIETKAAYGCDPVRVAMTVLEDGTPSALPASCTLTAGLYINGAASTGLVTVLASASVSGDDENVTGAGWVRNDTRGLSFAVLGAGCTGARTAELEWTCSGE